MHEIPFSFSKTRECCIISLNQALACTSASFELVRCRVNFTVAVLRVSLCVCLYLSLSSNWKELLISIGPLSTGIPSSLHVLAAMVTGKTHLAWETMALEPPMSCLMPIALLKTCEVKTCLKAQLGNAKKAHLHNSPPRLMQLTRTESLQPAG